MTTTPDEVLRPETRAFYTDALRALSGAGVPFLLAGAYAFARYTGIVRHTKDLDVFVRPADAEAALAALAAAGYRTELTFPHWLGKAYHGDDFVDVIYRSANGVWEIGDGWFQHAVEDTVHEVPVRLCAPEEIVWSKAFIMERERYDGADVAHILHARAKEMDWRRVLGYFEQHWRVLLTHLILFGFIYPDKRTDVPPWVMRELLGRLETELERPGEPPSLCQGTIISREQYLPDVQRWGYQDARQQPFGTLTAEAIADWTAAIYDERR